MVDLQKSQDFQALGVELMSIAPDTVESWRDDGREYGIQDYRTVLSDVENEVEPVRRNEVGGGHR